MALGVIFIIVPLFLAKIYHIDLCGKMMAALAKLLLRVGIIGGVLYLLVQSNSVALDIICAFALVVYSAASVVVKARLGFSQFIVPVGAGILVATLFVGVILLFANISISQDYCVRYVLPVVALLSGGIVEPMSKALATYYMGLRHHNHLYYYLIGNGASCEEAIFYLQKRAIERSFLLGIKRMSSMAIGVSPVVLWVMLMCGKTVLEATGWQVLIVLGVFAASVVAVGTALAIARKYVLDGYARIKSEIAEQEEVSEIKNEDDEEI